jgi:Plasmid pRiA4b ORF-3-like protein
MTDSRRSRRRHGVSLTLIAGGNQPGGGRPGGNRPGGGQQDGGQADGGEPEDGRPGGGQPGGGQPGGAGRHGGATQALSIASSGGVADSDDMSLADIRELMEALGAPPEMLEAVEGATDLDDVYEQLTASGLIPEPQDMLDGVIDSFGSLLEPGCDGLSAELAGVEFLALMRKLAPTGAHMTALLVAMVREASEQCTPAALAMVRVLDAVGPAELRRELEEAAGRLIDAGVFDPPWLARLGAPKPGTAFGYGDPLCEQEAIAVTFSYGRKRHAVAVLIDHGRGGGVKDCFFTSEPNMLRSGYRDAARDAGLEFREYQPSEARAILEQALGRPTVPEVPVQAMNVDMHLGLLRSRVGLLPAAGALGQPAARASRPRSPGQPPRAADRQTIHRLKITLGGSKPPIWRRLDVPSGITLQRLHVAIQRAFGWMGDHCWMFSTPAGDYGVRDPYAGHYSAEHKKLSAVAPMTGSRITYTYDFGDDWKHIITVEEVLPAEPGRAYPRCVTGRRACPPEGCGGMGEYANLLDILADPSHAEHEERLQRLGLRSADEFDPAEFDPVSVNEALAPLASVVRKR